MHIASLFDSEMFRWVILPILIFFARICDVTIGTIRIMFVSRGNKLIAPLLGFFEVLIWLIAIGQIMKNLNNIFCYVAYAGGFAMGNFIGIRVEEKLAVGRLVIRVITAKDAHILIDKLRERGFGVTNVDAEGSKGKVNIIFMIINRSHLQEVIEIIHKHNPNAFYSIEDTRFVKKGIFPHRESLIKKKFLKLPQFYKRIKFYQKFRIRKGK